MRILLTNHALTTAGGTELVVVELAQALRRRGHEIMIFSPRAGHVAAVLSNEKFPVFSDPADIAPRPDIIHGQHHMETMLALLHLSDVPCAYFCHGVIAWQECPPLHPRVLRYVFLSPISAQHLAVQHKLPEERFRIIPNHVHLARFRDSQPRPTLKKAAICNRVATKPELVAELTRVCEKRGISVDVIWDWCRGTVDNVEALFASHDLVFGTGRTAIEAMAAGCAVSTSSHDKIGPLITPDNFHQRREFNFSLAGWEHGIEADMLGDQLDGFSAAAHSRIHEMVFQECGIDREARLAEEVYEEVITEWRGSPRHTDEMPALRHYLGKLAPLYDIYDDENKRARTENAWLIAARKEALDEIRIAREHSTSLEEHNNLLIQENQKLSAQREELKKHLSKCQQSAAVAEARLSLARDVLNKSLPAKLFLGGLRAALNPPPKKT